MLSRRRFLSLAGTSALLAACSKKRHVLKVDTNPDTNAPVSLVVSTYDHVTGIDQRIAVAFIQGNAPVKVTDPVDLVIKDEAGKASPAERAEAHLDGPDPATTPSGTTPGLPYYVVRHRFDKPGIYQVESTYKGKTLNAALQVTVPGALGTPSPGQPMISVPTPTPADGRGVNPICTRQPACPLHDVSLDAALGEHRPLAVLFATPLLCQSRLCGPTLDNLLAVRDEFATKVRFLHMEIYTDTSGKKTAPVVDAYKLQGEPFLFLARADGTVFDRLDNAVDQAEMRSALGKLAAA